MQKRDGIENTQIAHQQACKTERQCSKVPKRAVNTVNLTHVRQKNEVETIQNEQ